MRYAAHQYAAVHTHTNTKLHASLYTLQHCITTCTIQYTATGPCLVEVGTRCHGGEGSWQEIATEVVGYNQIDATFDAYVLPEKWAALPDRPMSLLKHVRLDSNCLHNVDAPHVRLAQYACDGMSSDISPAAASPVPAYSVPTMQQLLVVHNANCGCLLMLVNECTQHRLAVKCSLCH
eukprot:18969-Heterococcus_DN1.PRE.1